MPSFLLTMLPTDDLGLVVRALPIARELRALGHDVVCCNPAPAPRRVIADAGCINALPEHSIYGGLLSGRAGLAGLLDYVRSGRWRVRHRSFTALLRELLPAIPLRTAPHTHDVWSADHAGALLGMLDAGFVRASCAAMDEVMADWAPDVVVDFWNPFAAIAARTARLPLVTVIQADAHPRAQGFLWWQRPSGHVPSATPTVNRILRERGLPSIRRLEDLSVGDRTLVVGTRETDPLPADADVTYVGPILWQREGASLPQWMNVERPRRRPLVWVYSGNPHYGMGGGALDSAVVLESCIAVLASEPVDVVLTTGHHPLPARMLPLPPNFHHEPFVPAIEMARRCQLLIHHGGYASCQLGLVAGRPAVILPTYSERESNARRMAAIGAASVVAVARQGRRATVDHEQLRLAVREVLRDPSYARRAVQAGDSLARQGGPRRAAHLIANVALAAARARARSSVRVTANLTAVGT